MQKNSQNLELAEVNVCMKLVSKLGTSHNLKKRTHILSRAGLGILMISCYTIFLKSTFDWKFIFISFVCYFHNCRGSGQGPPQEREVQGGGAPLKWPLRLISKREKICFQRDVFQYQLSIVLLVQLLKIHNMANFQF